MIQSNMHAKSLEPKKEFHRTNSLVAITMTLVHKPKPKHDFKDSKAQPVYPVMLTLVDLKKTQLD